MVKVKGTHGAIVDVQMLGVGEAIKRLRAMGEEVENAVDLGVIKAGVFIEEEVKESVIGKRVEPKSVDTGHFVNDIIFKKTGNAEGIIHAPNTPYAIYVEYSDRIRDGPRHHFTNTWERNEKKIQEIIKKEVDLAIKQQVAIGVSALKRLAKIF